MHNDTLPEPAPTSADMNKPVVPPSFLRRFGRALFAIPLALWMFFEEWVWGAMLAAMGSIAKLPPIRWMETQFTRLPPYAALAAFMLPALVLFPFKLAALWLIGHGHALYGGAVFVIAKIIGTAFLARIFALTKPALMQIGWFSRAYTAFTGWKARLFAYVRALPMYVALQERMTRVKRIVRVMWRRLRGKPQWD